MNRLARHNKLNTKGYPLELAPLCKGSWLKSQDFRLRDCIGKALDKALFIAILCQSLRRFRDTSLYTREAFLYDYIKLFHYSEALRISPSVACATAPPSGRA